MAIVKYKNQSGVTYAYESTSIWDPVKKQARPKRRYLGRVDEETGEIIPTAGKRGRPRKNSDQVPPAAEESFPAVDQISDEKIRMTISRLEEEVTSLRRENAKLKEVLSSIAGMAVTAVETQ